MINRNMATKSTLKINGIDYFSASGIIKELGVSRQTFWRWRQRQQIPAGHRFRDGRIVFTSQEVEAIKSYANSMESISRTQYQQGRLFENGDLGL
jgi:predicted DNA-binding transcriptional regulator AlpA